MAPLFCVHLLQAREPLRRDPRRSTDERGPQPAMHKGDLSFDQPADQDVLVIANGAGHREDLLAFRMRPPAPSNRPSRDRLCERRHRSSCGLEHDAVLANECESLARSHAVDLGFWPSLKTSSSTPSSGGSRDSLSSRQIMNPHFSKTRIEAML